jgi:dTDP-glucose 4,6-dehydratase
VLHLIAENHFVCDVDALTYAGNPSALSDLESHPNHEFHKLDIAKGTGLASALAAYAPDSVLNLADESHVDRSIDGPGQFIESNVVGTSHLLQASLGYCRSLGPEQCALRPPGSSLKSYLRFTHLDHQLLEQL